jgi:MFS family permease
MSRTLIHGNSPDVAAVSPARRNANWLFGMLFLLYMFDYLDRMVVASLFPFMKADLGLTDTQSGALVSAVYLSIVIFAFPASILVDRWSRKRSIGLMVGVWSVATGMCAFVAGFPHLIMARMFVGAGEAGYAPGGNALISAMYPQEKRSRMLGFWNAAIPLGSALGTGLGGVIAAKWGWRHAFGLVALPGLLVGLLFFFFARDYKTIELIKRSEDEKARRMSRRDILRQFTGTPTLLFTYLGFIGNTFMSTAFLTWLPTYLYRYAGVPEAQAGLRGGAVMLLALVGAPAGGILADAWIKKRRNARLLLPGISTILSSLVFFVAFAFTGGALQYALFLVGGVLAVVYVSGASAVTQDVVHPGLWAISYSICVVVQNFFGSSLGPLAVGAFSDAYGLRTAMILVPLVSFVGGIFFLIGSRFYVRDAAKVERVKIELED